MISSARNVGLSSSTKSTVPKIPFTKNGKNDLLQLISTQLPTGNTASSALPGTVLNIERGNGILVKCKEGSLWLKEVQPAGKKPMPAEAFANGYGVKSNDGAFVE